MSGKRIPGKPVALDKAQELNQFEGPVAEMFSTGVMAIIRPVSVTLVDDVVAGVEAPRVPTYYNEEKGREEENPGHPDYLDAMQKYNNDQARAKMEALIMFGIELPDGLPEDDIWLRRVQWLAKRNASFSLDGYDLDDPLDLEYLYKRFIVVGTADFFRLLDKAGLTPAAVEEAAKAFKSNQT